MIKAISPHVKYHNLVCLQNNINITLYWANIFALSNERKFYVSPNISILCLDKMFLIIQ
jgi:hypothetical protein